jgi:hypothetical protein
MLSSNPEGEWIMGKRYTVSDGKLMLNLEEAEEGGYIVTSPIDPELITEAESQVGVRAGRMKRNRPC